MRILFAGSPAIAVPALESLVSLTEDKDGITLVGLLTNPDSPRGRGGKPEPTDCARALERLSAASVSIVKPEQLDAAAREQIAALKPDLLVAFAYGRIFGPRFLALFPQGGINIHPSLLPRYRGPTPIPAAIINRETATGITLQRLAPEMDCGDIVVQETVPLSGRETTVSLSRIMANKAAELLPLTLKGIVAGTVQARPQNHSEATYCHLLEKRDGLINWKRSAPEIDARIRAFDPWPLSWTTHGELQLFILKAESLLDKGHTPAAGDTQPLPGQVLGKDHNNGILIQTGDGILAVQELQYQTKKALVWRDFLNGTQNFIGTRLG